MTVSLAFQCLLLVAFAGCAAEVAVLVAGVLRWWPHLGDAPGSPADGGGQHVPVCFVVVDVEPTSVSVRRVLDRLATEHEPARSFEVRLVLPGEAADSAELLDALEAVALPSSRTSRSHSIDSFAIAASGRAAIVFQGGACFGALIRRIALAAKAPYVALLPASDLPDATSLEGMVRALAERSDDPVVLGGPALALGGVSGRSSWRELRRATADRSALLAWSGPRGPGTLRATPVLVSRERAIGADAESAGDRGEWLERLGDGAVVVPVSAIAGAGAAAARCVDSLRVDPPRVDLFQVDASRSSAHPLRAAMSALAPARVLLLAGAVVLTALGAAHAGWLALAVAASLVLPTCVCLLGQLALESASADSEPEALLRLAWSSASLAPFGGSPVRGGMS